MNDLHCNANKKIHTKHTSSSDLHTLYCLVTLGRSRQTKNQCLDFRFMNSLANNTKSDKFTVRSSMLLNRMQAHRRAETYCWISACLLHAIFFSCYTRFETRSSSIECNFVKYQNHYIWLASIERHCNWQVNLWKQHTKFRSKI